MVVAALAPGGSPWSESAHKRAKRGCAAGDDTERSFHYAPEGGTTALVSDLFVKMARENLKLTLFVRETQDRKRV